MIALAAGFALSQIDIGPHSSWDFLAFQGTADDARSLLVTIAGTVVTVIALVLGLTVVALQLSSTQFSPRLLRNFLRDRGTQLVLSVFLATFAYSAAGLYTVGVCVRHARQTYPRLAVSGAMVLLFISLAMVVFYANHLAHSIQIDSIAKQVGQITLSVVGKLPREVDEDVSLAPPAWAVPLTSTRSGYLQTDHAEELLPLAVRHGVSLLVRLRDGEHIVAGTVLAWAWAHTEDDPRQGQPSSAPQSKAPSGLGSNAQWSRTPHSASASWWTSHARPSPRPSTTPTQPCRRWTVSVIFCALAVRPLGPVVRSDPTTGCSVIVPGRTFADYLSTMCGLIRRYGRASRPFLWRSYASWTTAPRYCP